MKAARTLAVLHRWAGWLGVAAFLTSGLYMHFGLGHLAGYPDDRRMVFRACHIAILFSALLNLVIGSQPRSAAGLWRARSEYAGSVLTLVALPIFVVAFMVEPHQAGLQRPWYRIAVIATAVGVITRVIAVHGHAGRSRG